MTAIHNGAAVAEHLIGRTGEVAIRVHAGSVDVRGTDGETVRVEDLDGRPLDERFELELSARRFALRPRDRAIFDLGRGRKHRHSARLVVEVPTDASVSLDTASADLVVARLSGEQAYRTASGDLTIRDVAGVLAVDAVSGDVRIDAVGPVELSGRLVSGDLRVEGGSLPTVVLATTSGDIDLLSPLVGPGPYSFQTVSGDVQAAVRGGIDVDARTVTGEIVSDAPHRAESSPGRRRVVVGDGALRLEFRSISGDLRLLSATPGAAASPAAPEPPAPPAPPAPAPSVDAEPGSRLREEVPDEADEAEARRLEILRALEAGEIDIATATERLAELEPAGDD